MGTPLETRIIVFLNSDEGGMEPATSEQISAALSQWTPGTKCLDEALRVLQHFAYILNVGTEDEPLWVSRISA